jgi:hypothetical protein
MNVNRPLSRLAGTPAGVVAALTFACLFVFVPDAASSSSSDRGFLRYTDPAGRFSFEYPASMKVESASAHELHVSHPQAAFRITVFVEERPQKGAPTPQKFVEMFKKKLQEDLKDAVILEEGTLQGLSGAQGYFVCLFKNPKGLRMVQLVQCYVTEDRLFQMIISDRPEGFRNLEKVVRKIHQSLRITNPTLR